jgi:hypothetical protein
MKAINSTRDPHTAPPLPSPGDLPVRFDPSRQTLPPSSILSEEEQICALVEGSKKFKNRTDLLRYIDQSEEWYLKLREKPAYRELVRRTIRGIAERVTDEAENIGEMFNSQIKSSVVTLAEIRDNPFAKEGDRIKAANSLLDRATQVPRPKDAENMNDFLKLMVPVQQMQAINSALQESGETKLIDLMQNEEGDHWELEGDEKEEEELNPIEANEPTTNTIEAKVID